MNRLQQILVQLYHHIKHLVNFNKAPGIGPCVDNKSKNKKTLFNVRQCKQYNISSHMKWALVVDKSMNIIKKR